MAQKSHISWQYGIIIMAHLINLSVKVNVCFFSLSYWILCCVFFSSFFCIEKKKNTRIKYRNCHCHLMLSFNRTPFQVRLTSTMDSVLHQANPIHRNGRCIYLTAFKAYSNQIIITITVLIIVTTTTMTKITNTITLRNQLTKVISIPALVTNRMRTLLKVIAWKMTL